MISQKLSKSKIDYIFKYPKCKTKKNIFSDSIFENMKIDLGNSIKFAHLFYNEIDKT